MNCPAYTNKHFLSIHQSKHDFNDLFKVFQVHMGAERWWSFAALPVLVLVLGSGGSFHQNLMDLLLIGVGFILFFPLQNCSGFFVSSVFESR